MRYLGIVFRLCILLRSFMPSLSLLFVGRLLKSQQCLQQVILQTQGSVEWFPDLRLAEFLTSRQARRKCKDRQSFAIILVKIHRHLRVRLPSSRTVYGGENNIIIQVAGSLSQSSMHAFFTDERIIQ